MKPRHRRHQGERLAAALSSFRAAALPSRPVGDLAIRVSTKVAEVDCLFYIQNIELSMKLSFNIGVSTNRARHDQKQPG
ncbi:hypothetical protein [Salinicola avicenniae]|uniref:hypothetical protein n=1 Tax=Salinicola avicenniae TaxID=2916836 RepID=UPI002072B4E1|nr:MULTISPECIES: hypothetical protein [unclassified Salinicola]